MLRNGQPVASDELVPWLRQRIRERRYLAERTIELGSFAEWEERSSGVLVTGDGTDSDPWRGTWVTGDSSVTRLMEANDPRDTIARCESELAILDEYEAARKVMGDARDSPEGIGAGVFACVKTLNRAISLIGYGYRFWDGYDERAWKP